MRILQQDKPQDWVIATGVQYSVRDFIHRCLDALEMNVTWSGCGIEEKAIDQNGRTIIAIDGRYFRPTEVETTLGDASKARIELGWGHTTTFDELLKEMIDYDYQTAKREALMMEHGYQAFGVRNL